VRSAHEPWRERRGLWADTATESVAGIATKGFFLAAIGAITQARRTI
jgi:hypothetical protein